MTNALMLGVSPNPMVGVLQLSLEEHIQSLEKELFVLHACEPAPGVQTCAQKAHNPNPVTDALMAPKRSAPIPAPAPVLVQPSISAPQCPPPLSAILEETDNHNEPLVHPFSRAKDAMYAPPTTDNIAAKQKPPLLKKPDVPLRTTTPIHDPQVALTMYVRSMDLQITITQHELLLLFPEVRNQVWEATSNQHIIRTGTLLAPVNQNLLDGFAHINVTHNEDDHA